MLALTESHMASMYDSSGLSTCHGGTCSGLATTFLGQLSSGQGVSFLPVGANLYVILYFLSVLVILIAPAIIGIFWGAPLIARELDAGTFRLTWNQSITRTRWLTVKLTLIGLAAIFAAFQALVPLWIRPNLFPTSQTTATIAASGANVSLRANPALTLTASIVPGRPGTWIISSEGVNAAGSRSAPFPRPAGRR